MRNDQVIEVWHQVQPIRAHKESFIAKNELDYSNPENSQNKENKFLDPVTDKKARQNLVQDISKVVSSASKKKSKVTLGLYVMIFYTKEEFIIKVTPQDKDEFDRSVPVITYSKFPEQDSLSLIQNWIKVVSDNTINFIQSPQVGRQLDDPEGTLKDISEGLQKAWDAHLDPKKNLGKLISFFDVRTQIGWLGLALLIPILINFIRSRNRDFK